MKRPFFVSFISAAMILAGCTAGPGSGAKGTTDMIPQWYEDLPSDPVFFFAAAAAVSRDRQLAVDKATQRARGDLGSQIKARIERLAERFYDEAKLKEDDELRDLFARAGDAVISEALINYRIDDQEIRSEDNSFRSFMLMSLSWADARSGLIREIKTQQTLYDRLKNTQAFKELLEDSGESDSDGE
jgi:hypothetical protein